MGRPRTRLHALSPALVLVLAVIIVSEPAAAGDRSQQSGSRGLAALNAQGIGEVVPLTWQLGPNAGYTLPYAPAGPCPLVPVGPSGNVKFCGTDFTPPTGSSPWLVGGSNNKIIAKVCVTCNEPPGAACLSADPVRHYIGRPARRQCTFDPSTLGPAENVTMATAGTALQRSNSASCISYICTSCVFPHAAGVLLRARSLHEGVDKRPPTAPAIPEPVAPSSAEPAPSTEPEPSPATTRAPGPEQSEPAAPPGHAERAAETAEAAVAPASVATGAQVAFAPFDAARAAPAEATPAAAAAKPKPAEGSSPAAAGCATCAFCLWLPQSSPTVCVGCGCHLLW